MATVYVEGIGGLGNCLFQLATAISYCEQFNMKLCLINTTSLLLGTSDKFGRKRGFIKDNKSLSYDKTIFSKLEFINKLTVPCQIVKNDYSMNRIVPEGKNIVIKGYNQNINLFLEYSQFIPKYLNFDDAYIKNYIYEKYGNIEDGVAICVRIDKDYGIKFGEQGYINGINELERLGEKIDKLYVIGDVPVDKFFKKLQSYKTIDESDIVQFYFALQCKNYILSGSTFHLWMAYLGTDFGKRDDKNVICFNNTDITNRPLSLDTFKKIDFF